MKLNTWPKTKNLFFESTSRCRGGLMTPTDMFSHEIPNGLHGHYVVFKYPPYKHTSNASKRCKLSPDSIRATQVKK